MKNSESEIMTKKQKSPYTIKNAKRERDLVENKVNIINKPGKMKRPSYKEDEENLSSEEQEENYTDIEESSIELSDLGSSSYETDNDSELTENSDEVEDASLKRYIDKYLDNIIDVVEVPEDVELESDDVDDGEEESDDDDEDAFDEASMDEFLNEISYNYLMSDEIFNNDVCTDPEEVEEPFSTDVIIEEVDEDVIKLADSREGSDAKSERCNDVTLQLKELMNSGNRTGTPN